MMKPTIRLRLLLNVTIALLALFNGIQIAGIVSEAPVAVPGEKVRDSDTSFVPMQINVLNGNGVNGVGTVMTAFCRRIGYDVVEMGNYKTFDVPQSLVIDRSGTMEDGRALAAKLGISGKNVIQQFSSDQMVGASVVIGKDYQSLTPWKK